MGAASGAGGVTGSRGRGSDGDVRGGGTACGVVAAVGLTGGSELSSTVLPFLLRGVNLLGIDSVMCPKTPRVETWRRVARDLPMDKLREMVEIHSLDDLPRLGAEILAGGVRGRAVIKVA